MPKYFQAVIDNPPAAPAAPSIGVAPATPAAPAPAPTALAASPEPAAQPPSTWPDDWRTKVSGDEKHLKTLERFATPKELWSSYEALRQRLSSGELKSTSPFPDKGTPEEQVSWRKEHNVPEAPDKYDLKLDTKLVKETDKPFVDEYLKTAHALNLSPDVAKANVEWFMKLREDGAAEQLKADTELKEKTEETMRAEWGAEYPKNKNLIKGLLATAPEALRDRLASARLADGTAIFNDPDMLRYFAGLAREINPVATVVGAAGAGMATAIADELATLTKMMRENRKEWNASPAKQARYMELTEAQAKMQKQA